MPLLRALQADSPSHMKLVVKELGEEAHGTTEFGLSVEGWPNIGPTREEAQKAADYINFLLQADDLAQRLVRGLV